MERGPLSDPKFKAIADKYILLLHVTSYVDDRKYDDLLQEKDGRAFPSVMYLDAAGEVITRDATSYSLPAMLDTSNRVEHFLELKQRAAKGGPADKINLEIARCDLGQIEFYDLEELVDVTKLSPEQEKAYLAQKANATAQEQTLALVY